MSFETILFILHSTLRWLIVLVALIAIVKFARGLSQQRAFDGMSRGLTAAYSGLIDLQVLIGILLLVLRGPLGTPQIVHGILMIAAAVVAHLSARWRGAPDTLRYRMNLLMVVLSLLLIVFGVGVLGFERWIPRLQ
jgi:uncharacterized membrane protein YphA (DoxX/SURF4 family)